MATCRNLGARRGRGVHGRLPIKIGALPGPASKCMEAVERWGALEARAALGTVGVPVGAHGGDALRVRKASLCEKVGHLTLSEDPNLVGIVTRLGPFRGVGIFHLIIG